MNTLTNDITPRQAAFLNGLLSEAADLLVQRQVLTGEKLPDAEAGVNGMSRKVDAMTKREASAAIDSAMDNNRLLRAELKTLGAPAAPAPVAPRPFVTETGMYQVDGRIFKVLPSRSSDRLYAKELVGEFESGYAFEYAPGAMRLIAPEHRMSDEQAREFGRTTGHCCVCARLLTDPKSIAAGIGPVCDGKR